MQLVHLRAHPDNSMENPAVLRTDSSLAFAHEFGQGIPLEAHLQPPGLSRETSLLKFREPDPSVLLPVQSPLASTRVVSSPKFPTPLTSKAFSLAALYVDAALHGRKFVGFADNEFVSVRVGDPSDNSLKLRVYRLLHSSIWRILYISVCCTHVSLAALEKPAMVSWGHVGFFAACLIEWACMLAYIVDLNFAFMLSPNLRSFFKQPWRSLRVGIVCVMLLDLIVLVSSGLDYSTFRFSRGLRPFMLIFRLRNLRKVFAACVSTIKRALLIFALIGFLILMFGFVGYSILCDTSESK